MGLSFQLVSKVAGLGGKALILKNWAAENSGSPKGINGWGKDLSLLVSTGKHLLLQGFQLSSGEADAATLPRPQHPTGWGWVSSHGLRPCRLMILQRRPS